MLRTMDHRLLNNRHTYSLLLRCSYTLVQRCCTFPHHHNNLIKPRTARSSPSPCPCPCPCSVPAAKMLNPPPPPVVVVISNALRSAVLKPLLPPMSDSAIAGHMSNLMKQQQPPALPSHLLRVGGPFSARADLLLPLLYKPTLPRFPCRGGVILLPAAAAAGSSLYNYYYITNFNFNAAAAATARRQFSTSPSSTEPVPQGSTPPSFPAADERPAVNVNQGGDAHAVVVISSCSSSEASNGGNTQKLDVMDDMESQMPKNRPLNRPLWRRVFWNLVLFYWFFSLLAGIDIHTSPLTNRKIIVSQKKLEEVDKHFRKSIAGSETLPSTDHFSCKVRSMLEEILSNMDKVIKQRPQSLNGIKWEIVASEVPAITAQAYPNGKIIISPSSRQWIDTDGKLAFTIGHEVAHVVAEHGYQIYGNIRLGAGLIAFMHTFSVLYIAQPFTFLGIPLFPLLAFLCLFIRVLCLSQRNELEADYIGMLLSASAGYDPREAHKYFTDEDWVTSSRIPSFLRVHPPDEKRAEALLQNKRMKRGPRRLSCELILVLIFSLLYLFYTYYIATGCVLLSYTGLGFQRSNRIKTISIPAKVASTKLVDDLHQVYTSLGTSKVMVNDAI